MTHPLHMIFKSHPAYHRQTSVNERFLERELVLTWFLMFQLVLMTRRMVFVGVLF